MNAGACGVEAELADGDAHAVDAEVAEPEDTRAVGDDGDFDIVRPVLDDLVEVAAVFEGQVEACRKLAYLERHGTDSSSHLLAGCRVLTSAGRLRRPWVCR